MVAPPGRGLHNHTVTESSSLGKLANPDRGDASLSPKHPLPARLGIDAITRFHCRFTQLDRHSYAVSRILKCNFDSYEAFSKATLSNYYSQISYSY